METRYGAETAENAETAPPGDSSHTQLPNTDNAVDAKKCMLTGA